MTAMPLAGSMPSFLRRWVAKENHEGLLRSALLRLNTDYAAQHAHLVEATLYREHFAEREFLGVATYDDEKDVESTARRDLLRAFERVEAAHAEEVTRSLRIETVSEYRAIPQNGVYGAAVILRSRPDQAGLMRERLTALAADLIERFAPSRVLIHHAVDEPGLFFTICDSHDRIDLDRYLGSSLLQEHRATVGSLLVEHARWFSLDPLWHYFRRLGEMGGPERAPQAPQRSGRPGGAVAPLDPTGA